MPEIRPRKGPQSTIYSCRLGKRRSWRRKSWKSCWRRLSKRWNTTRIKRNSWICRSSKWKCTRISTILTRSRGSRTVNSLGCTGTTSGNQARKDLTKRVWAFIGSTPVSTRFKMGWGCFSRCPLEASRRIWLISGGLIPKYRQGGMRNPDRKIWTSLWRCEFKTKIVFTHNKTHPKIKFLSSKLMRCYLTTDRCLIKTSWIPNTTKNWLWLLFLKTRRTKTSTSTTRTTRFP